MAKQITELRRECELLAVMAVMDLLAEEAEAVLELTKIKLLALHMAMAQMAVLVAVQIIYQELLAVQVGFL